MTNGHRGQKFAEESQIPVKSVRMRCSDDEEQNTLQHFMKDKLTRITVDKA